jgi:hypothetical protein
MKHNFFSYLSTPQQNHLLQTCLTNLMKSDTITSVKVENISINLSSVFASNRHSGLEEEKIDKNTVLIKEQMDILEKQGFEDMI